MKTSWIPIVVPIWILLQLFSDLAVLKLFKRSDKTYIIFHYIADILSLEISSNTHQSLSEGTFGGGGEHSILCC